jgi:hypothetical protein
MFALRTEECSIDDTTPDRYGFAQRIWHTLSSPRRVDNNCSSMFLNHIKKLQVQPPQAKTPLTHVTIRALEVDAFSFLFWRNIPRSAALVGHERKLVSF